MQKKRNVSAKNQNNQSLLFQCSDNSGTLCSQREPRQLEKSSLAPWKLFFSHFFRQFFGKEIFSAAKKYTA